MSNLNDLSSLLNEGPSICTLRKMPAVYCQSLHGQEEDRWSPRSLAIHVGATSYLVRAAGA